ncbi:hypothetical protein BCR35DRAFT_333051 [Leucosporidium creatinivorum]|uniref:Uncharacterized protein n=1 Tax=Leucosporidium creatinivorum TaxID=106004 RepID=A0A1Y2EWM4_9BASI|nr:hypothetical protein BCR35DRAFT_333051 [Leucosporidium creatinivorum]
MKTPSCFGRSPELAWLVLIPSLESRVSTGEVAAFGADVAEAYFNSLTSTKGLIVPRAKS